MEDLNNMLIKLQAEKESVLLYNAAVDFDESSKF